MRKGHMGRAEYLLVSVFLLVPSVAITGPVFANEERSDNGRAASAPATSTSAEIATPASRPASEILLVRLGDTTAITQADYDYHMRNADVDDYARLTDGAMSYLVAQRLFELYLEQHPDLVPQERIEAMLERSKKRLRVSTLDELDTKLRLRRSSLEDLKREHRVLVGRSTLIARGEKEGKDEAIVKKMFDADPSAFDNTRVAVRHIVIRSRVYDTPKERAKQRARLAKIREALVSGSKTWEECVTESEASQFRNGYLGYLQRHSVGSDAVGQAIFAIKKGDLSEIIETRNGFQLIEVMDRKEGTRTLNKRAKRNIQLWLQQMPFNEIQLEMERKYPIVGVQPPGPPSHLLDILKQRAMSAPASAPVGNRATRPAHER